MSIAIPARALLGMEVIAVRQTSTTALAIPVQMAPHASMGSMNTLAFAWQASWASGVKSISMIATPIHVRTEESVLMELGLTRAFVQVDLRAIGVKFSLPANRL